MSMKIPVSAAIITFNEESKIEACLESLGWAEEIVVVDSLSRDATVEICRRMGAKVHSREFLGHVRQKQMAVDFCSRDWVFCIDADERVCPELSRNLISLFADGPPPLNGYAMNRRSFYLARHIRHGGWYPDRKIRLFDRRRGKWGGYDPHDKVLIEGAAGFLEGDLNHYPFKDLSQNVAANNKYSSIMADDLHRDGKRFSLLKLIFKPAGKFAECYLVKRGFLDGVAGLVIAVGAAYSMFLKQAKLWEKSLPKTRSKPGGAA